VTQALRGRVEHCGVVGMEHWLNREKARMPTERLHGAEDHRPPANHSILLWASGAGAKAAPGRNKHRCSPLRFGHETRMTVIAVEKQWPRRWCRPFVVPALQAANSVQELRIEERH